MEPNTNTNPQPQPGLEAASPPASSGPQKPVPAAVPPPEKMEMAVPVTAGTPPKDAAPYPHNTADAVPPTDKICYESQDKQIIVHQMVIKTAKFPPSRYPCIVLQCQPRPNTRVREIDGNYVEIMPTFKELEQFVDAINDAAVATGKGKLYEVLQRVPEKSEAHKRKWRRFNEERLGLRKPRWKRGKK